MADELTIESLRAAIRGEGEPTGDPDEVRFERLGRRFEGAVAALAERIREMIDQIPELDLRLEDEIEVFTSPAFPGRELRIRDQRVRIVRGDDMILFDPTAKALLSALGQVEVQATRPLPFMIEKVLYLIPDRGGRTARWGYRAAEDPAGLTPFTRSVLLRMLQAVFT